MDHDTLSTKLRIGSPPAPGRLALLEGFLNTWSEEMGIDDFETAQSTETWLRNVDLWTGAQKITQEQHRRIVKFRSDLRIWILNKDRTEPLTDLAKEISFQAEFTSEGEVQFRPTGTPFQRALGALIDLISKSLQDGSWDRLKCCELPTCGWAFYDSTRSRTRRWCSMKTCGSRHKAREYYKRHR
jgi:predicted RNA-binding Zn ribbon-like protein